MPAHFTFTTGDQLAHHLPTAPLTGVSLHFGDGSTDPAAPGLVEALANALAAIHSGATVHLAVDEDLVTAERAAQLLGVSRPAVYIWQDRGLLRRVSVGNKRMVPLADVLRLRTENEESRALARRLYDEIKAHPDPEADYREAIEFLRATNSDSDLM